MTQAWHGPKGRRKAAEHSRDSGRESGQAPPAVDKKNQPTAGGKAMNHHGKEEKRAAENKSSHQLGAA